MGCLTVAIDAVVLASGYLVVECVRAAMTELFRLSVEAAAVPRVGENSRD